MYISKSLKYFLLFAVAMYTNISVNFPNGDFTEPAIVGMIFAVMNIFCGIAIFFILGKKRNIPWWGVALGAVAGGAAFITVEYVLTMLSTLIATNAPVLLAVIINIIIHTVCVLLYPVAIFFVVCLLQKQQPKKLFAEITSRKNNRVFRLAFAGITVCTLVVQYLIQVCTTTLFIGFAQTSGFRYMNVLRLFVVILSTAIVMVTVMHIDGNSLSEKSKFTLTKNGRAICLFIIAFGINTLFCSIIMRITGAIDMTTAFVFINFIAGVLIIAFVNETKKIAWNRLFISAAFGALIYAVVYYGCYEFTLYLNPIASEATLLTVSIVRTIIFISMNIAAFYAIACLSFRDAIFPLKLTKSCIGNLVGILVLTVIFVFCIHASLRRVTPSNIFGDFGRVGWRYSEILTNIANALPTIVVMMTAMWIEKRGASESKHGVGISKNRLVKTKGEARS